MFHNLRLSGEFGVARRLSSLIETGGLQAVLLGPSWACELLLREGYDTFLSFSHLMSREAHHKQMIIFIPFQSAESLMYESAKVRACSCLLLQLGYDTFLIAFL